MKESSILKEIQAQYIIDKKGEKTGVILKIKIFERLLEELEDFYLGSMAKEALKNDSEFHSLDDVKQEILNGKKK